MLYSRERKREKVVRTEMETDGRDYVERKKVRRSVRKANKRNILSPPRTIPTRQRLTGGCRRKGQDPCRNRWGIGRGARDESGTTDSDPPRRGLGQTHREGTTCAQLWVPPIVESPIIQLTHFNIITFDQTFSFLLLAYFP